MRNIKTALSALFLLALGASTLPAQTDWPQFAMTPDKSANNTAETQISLSTVTGLTPLFTVPLTDNPDGAPVLLTGVSTSGGVRDLIFVQGEKGHITAFDANTGATVWSQDFAAGVNNGAPAIDPNRQFIYVDTGDGKVHKLNVGSGSEVTSGGWPMSSGGGKAGSEATIAVAANGHTYLYLSNHGEGHITTIDVTAGTEHVFNASCSQFPDVQNPSGCTSTGARPWGRGMPYVASLDRFFFSTGNNNGNAWNGCNMWKESLLSLPADGSTRLSGGCGYPADSWTGTDVTTTVAKDQDIGSGGITPLPIGLSSKYPHLAVNPGKDARIRLINLDNMSGMGGPGHQGGQIEELSFSTGSLMRAQSAVWTDSSGRVWVFVVGNSGTHGFTVDVDSAGNPSLDNRWNINNGWTTSAVVANGVLFTAVGGGEHSATTATHTLQAIDPETGTVVWSASIGQFHWTSPIVANGIVYMCDGNSGGFGTGTGGNLHAWHLKSVAAGFTVSATPASESVSPGGTASYTVSVGAVGGFSGTVTLAVSGEPAGSTAKFSPATITGSGTSTLTISVPSSAGSSTSTLTVSGASGGVTHSAAPVTLTVAPPAGFTISATPASQTVAAGGSTMYTVDVTPLDGFTGTVDLAVTGLPTGATGTFMPTSISGSGESSLTVATATTTPAGTSTLNITGTSGTLSSSTTTKLVVTSTTPCTTVSAGAAFTNTAIPAQTGTFTLSYDGSVSKTPTNSYVGLSHGAATSNDALAIVISFSDTGDILALDGGTYKSVTALKYVAGVSYHFDVTVNLTAHTYSVTATPSGGTATTIATDYAFRTSQDAVDTLDNFAQHDSLAGSGTFTVCNLAP